MKSNLASAVLTCALLAWGCRRDETCPDPSEVRFCRVCYHHEERSVKCVLGVIEKRPLDLRPLRRLPRLELLDLAGRPVDDLGPLAHLPGLRHLNLLNTGVAELRPIAGLRLTGLQLGNTQVRDLEPLRAMTTLVDLDLHGTKVEDFTPLSLLRQLEGLGLGRTSIRDLAPLRGLARLERLDLQNTRVEDLTPLLGLSRLRSLYVSEGAFKPDDLERLRRASKQLEIRVFAKATF